MSEKGNARKEMLERFEGMGIPKPLAPIKNPKSTAKNPETLSKIEQIRNGALKGEYQNFLEKAEKVSAAPTSLPVPKVGKKPSEKPTNTPEIKSFTKKTTEASLYESALYGDLESSTQNSSYNSKSEVSDFGPTNTDTRSLLQQRLYEKQNLTNESQEKFSNNNVALTMTDAELTEKITEISKNMIKKVLVEFTKKEGGLIVESKNIKKAEILGNGKVKIGGKIYLLRPVQ